MLSPANRSQQGGNQESFSPKMDCRFHDFSTPENITPSAGFPLRTTKKRETHKDAQHHFKMSKSILTGRKMTGVLAKLLCLFCSARITFSTFGTVYIYMPFWKWLGHLRLSYRYLGWGSCLSHYCDSVVLRLYLRSCFTFVTKFLCLVWQKSAWWNMM